MKTNAPATQSRRRYRARRAAGICTQCGHAPAEPGRPMCQACRLVTNEATRRYQRKHRIVAVVLSLCTQCCQRERMPCTKWCGVCAEAHTERQRAIREARRAQGRCARCGGSQPCEACRAVFRERSRRYRARLRARGLRRTA
jgi:hypothetical protein